MQETVRSDQTLSPVAPQELEFRRLLDSLPAAAYTCDAEGRITYCNDRAVALWGKEPRLNDPADRYCGSCRLYSPENAPIEHDMCWMAQALRENREFNELEIIIERPDGERRRVNAHAAPIRDGEGRVVGGVNLLVDITESRAAEEALRESEERHRLLSELTADFTAIGRVEENGEITLVSVTGGFDTVTGYSLEEVNARGGWPFLILPDDLPLVRRSIERLLSGAGDSGEVRIVARSGAVRWVRYLGHPVVDPDGGQVRRIYLAAQDMTGRKAGEEALRRSEEFLRGVVETTPAWIKVVANDGTIVETNPAGLVMLEAGSPGQVEGRKVYDVLADEYREPYRDFHERVCRGERGSLEFEIVGLRGTRRRVETHAAPLRGADGEFMQLAVTQDITERKRTEESLREMNLALGHAMPGISTLDREGRYANVNSTYAQMTGYEPGEMLGMNWDATVHPEDRERAAAAYERMLSEGRCEFEARGVRKDGTVFHKHVLMVRRLDREGALIGHHCFMKDITDRKRSEVQLWERAEEIEKLMNVMPVAVWIARDPECKNITGNRAGYAMLRMPEGANLSKSADEPDRPAHFRVYHQGRELTPQELPMQYAAAHGLEVSGFEEEIVFEDGVTAHVYGSATPLLDGQGKVRGSIAAFMDVSELTRLRDELRRQAAELTRADRRKDEFLATLAHELRNPLAPLRNALELIRRANGDAAVIEKARTLMERQLQQMVRLIDDLLDLSRISTGRLNLVTERVELAAVLNTAVETARPPIEASGHELTVTLPPRPVYLEADSLRLAQVFANLLNNAAKYTNRGGHIWVTVDDQGGDVLVSVRDTGIGIPPEHLPRLFEMFSQVTPALERSHGGLGIGLALVKGLVELHGGSVEARSRGAGLGSEFTVRLPAIQAPAQAPPGPPCEGGAGSVPSYRILVVDDNRDSAETMGDLLQVMGHQVQTAFDGLEAVQAAAAFRPDVILMDIGMPRMNGYEAARRIRAEPWGRDLLLIAVTGWGQQDDRERAREAGFDHHLTKPVEPAVLLGLLSGTRAPC